MMGYVGLATAMHQAWQPGVLIALSLLIVFCAVGLAVVLAPKERRIATVAYVALAFLPVMSAADYYTIQPDGAVAGARNISPPVRVSPQSGPTILRLDAMSSTTGSTFVNNRFHNFRTVVTNEGSMSDTRIEGNEIYGSNATEVRNAKGATMKATRIKKNIFYDR